MSAPAFRVVSAAGRGPRFPSPRYCRDRGCVCRRYPGRGWYILVADRHAMSWDLRREDADATARASSRLVAGSLEAGGDAPTETGCVPCPPHPLLEPGPAAGSAAAGSAA